MRAILSALSERPAGNETALPPILRNAGAAVSGIAVRLFAYAGALAFLGVLGLALCDALAVDMAAIPALRQSLTAQKGWIAVSLGGGRLSPAFAVSQSETLGKAESYEILRHSEGGRRDVLRWAAAAGEKPVADIELYRPGGELNAAGPMIDAVAARMDGDVAREIEAAGVIDSKFGAVTLLGFSGRTDGPAACLGFMKNLGDANLRVSGYTCQGNSHAARRAAVGCLLDRLTLLSAGGDPKLSELFARAELRRTGRCSAARLPQSDWIASGDKVQLRGRVMQN